MQVQGRLRIRHAARGTSSDAEAVRVPMRVRIAILAPLKVDAPSGLRAPWGPAPTLGHVLERASEKAELDVDWVDLTDDDVDEKQLSLQLVDAIEQSHICLALEIDAGRNADVVARCFVEAVGSKTWLSTERSDRQNESVLNKKQIVCLNCAPALEASSSVLAYANREGFLSTARHRFFRRKDWKRGKQLLATMKDLYSRYNADDLSYLMRLYASECVRWDKEAHLDSGGPSLGTLACMLSNCGPEVLACFADERCRTALTKLSECGVRDQVKSYQIIVSYESELFSRFSLCVLQKHNCMGNTAEIPDSRTVLPLRQFRGAALTHEIAEDILMGWLKKGKNYSWRVYAGQNAAYDRFPCQYQLFYRGKAKGSMWYDPVFRVETLDGNLTWRRRHYRVRRGSQPGTFHFSVLDNGVVSKEFWKVVECDEDMSWCLLYYQGAAPAAGTAYQGSILGTWDGLMPSTSALERIESILRQCDIKPWELTVVSNECKLCADAPLELEEGGWI